MKVTVKERSFDKEYHWIGISRDIITLFIKPKKGICLQALDTQNYVGIYHEEWTEENFEPFSGEITLSNS